MPTATTPSIAEARIVVRFKPMLQPMSAEARVQTQATLANELANSTGNEFRPHKHLSSGAVVLKSSRELTAEQAQAALLELENNPAVLSAEPDVRVRPHVTNDTYYSLQWPLFTASSAVGAANFEASWPYSTGNGVTVAVLDTGSQPHPDLAGKQFSGYDFVTEDTYAADGSGRDSDPTDTGDACPTTGSASSWHGTAVASQITAMTNNGYGIAGAAPGTKVMHVRVLGKCGGWLSDTSDAIAWLAGAALPGVPTATVKPKVINLSLGASASCFQFMQDAVNAALSQGITVVAAAGNDASPTISTPANCAGVIAVGAHTASGDMANYSNYSAAVALTAPAGGYCKTQTGTACRNEPSLANGVEGNTTRTGWFEAIYFAGTSAAAPHVSAAAAILLAAKPSLTPSQIRSALISSARPHPANSFCATEGRCGAGMLDVYGALRAVGGGMSVRAIYGAGISRSMVTTTQVGLAPSSGQATLTAIASGGAGFAYAWRQTSGPSASILGGATASSLTFRAPAAVGLLQFEVTARNSSGGSAKTTISVRVNNAPTLTSLVLPYGKRGTAYAVQLPLKDGDGDSLTWGASNLPAGMTLVSGSKLSWSSPAAGTYTLVLTARDSYGQQVSAQKSLIVKKPNSAPRVPGGSFSLKSNTSANLALGIYDPDGDAISYSATGMPSGMYLSAGRLVWSKPRAGTYVVAVTARDSKGGAASGNYTVRVTNPSNTPPVVVTSEVIITATFFPYYGKIVARDPEGGSLTYSISSQPSGLKLSSNGALSWSRPVRGVYKVRVTVRDPQGLTGSRTVTFTVR